MLSLNRFGLLTSFVMFSLVASGAVLRAEDLNKASCDEVKPTSGAFDFCVDARDGSIASGKGYKYQRRDRVRIIILNKNPFLYDYSLKIEETQVPEPAFGDILSTLNVAVADQSKSEEKAAQEYTGKMMKGTLEERVNAIGSALSNVKGVTGCSGEEFDKATSLLKILSQHKDRAIDDGSKIEVDAKSFASALTSAMGQLKTGLPGPTLASLTLEVKTALETYKGSLGRFKSDMDTVNEDFSKMKAALSALQAKEGCAEAASAVQAQIKAAQDEVESQLKPALDHWSADIEQYKDLGESLNSVLADSRSFYDVREVGSYDSPENVTVQLDRVPKQGGSSQTMMTKTLNFGGGVRFAISGGISFAAMGKRQFVRGQGFEIGSDGEAVKDANGNPVFGTVIQETENSPTRITPLVIVHGKICDKICFEKSITSDWVPSIHMSLGVTAHSDNQGTDAEYLVGPSLGFAEDRMFLTVGLYGGRQQTLIGGLFNGEAVPEALNEIPVRKDLHWKLGFAVSYKIK